MNKYILHAGILISLLVTSGLTIGKEAPNSDERIRAAFTKLTGIDVTEMVITPIVVDQHYLVNLQGREAYVELKEGELVIAELVNRDAYEEKTMQSLTDKRLAEVLGKTLETYNEDDFIVFPSTAKETKKTITVFTDVDCGFCQALHNSVRAINDAGITVKYVPYVRAGVDSETMVKTKSVYCSSDRKAALTEVKSSGTIENKECENNLLELQQKAESAGVSFTPTVYVDDGRMIPGFPGEQEIIKAILNNQ